MWKLLCMVVILSITLQNSDVEGKAIEQPEIRLDLAGLNQENSIHPSKGLIDRLRRSPHAPNTNGVSSSSSRPRPRSSSNSG